MAGSDTVSGGTASVEIEGILVLNEESIKAAEDRLAQIGGSGESTPDGRPAGGAKAKGKKAASDVQAAVGKDVYELTINGGHVRAQIEAALKDAFKITIDADIRGALRQAGVGDMPPSERASASPMQRAEPDDRLKSSITTFGKRINELHDSLAKATTRLGQTFGSGATPLEKMADILEHFGAVDFKDLIELQKTGKHPKVVGGRASAATLEGRGFSSEEAGDVENILRTFTTGGAEVKQSDAMALVKRTRQWMGAPTAASDVERWDRAPQANAATNPAPQVAAAAEAVATPALDSIRAAEKTLKTTLARIPFQAVTPEDLVAKYPVDRSVKKFTGKPLGEAEVNKLLEKWDVINQDIVNLDSGLSAARGVTLGEGTGVVRLSKSDRNDRMRLFAAREGIESQLDFSDAVVAARLRGGVPRPPRPDDDPEATRRAMQQLGPRERANVRRGIGQFVPREIGGIQVDLEPLLKAARGEGSQQGEFQGLIQGTKTGKVARFAPSNEEEAARARAREKSNASFTVEGFGEQARNIQPSEAFWSAVASVYDDEITAQLRADPEVANLVSKSLAQGAAARPLVSPKAPRAGQGGGEQGGIVSASASGFEAGYHAAYRLLDTLGEIQEVSADIDGLWEKITERQGSGRTTARLEQTVQRREQRLSVLEARAKDLASKALDIGDPKLTAMAQAAGVGSAFGGTPESRAVLRAASAARDAAEAARSGGVYRNASQRIVGEQVGLTEEDIAQRVRSSPTLQGRAAKELGFDVAAQEMTDAILAKFNDPAFAGRNAETGETFPETSGQALGRAFREVVTPFMAGLPEKGPERKLGEQVVGDLRRGLFGEQEQVIEGVGSQAFKTRERRGGVLRIANEEAERAANLLEAGRGRGRVARIAREVPTGRHSNSGGVETAPDYLQPATTLDTERQALLGRRQAAADARFFAVREATQQAQRAAQARFPGVRVATNGGEESFMASGADQAGQIAGYKQFLARSVASRVARIPEAETGAGRLDEIKNVQAEANAHLARIAAASDDLTGQRAMAAVSTVGPEVYGEIKDVLSARTAGHARAPYTRDTGDIPTGDETSRRFRERGGMVAGEGGPQAPYRYKARESWETAGIAASAGTMHVIIAGQTAPVTVAMAGDGGGGGGGGGRGRPPAEPEEPMGPQHGPEDPRFVSAGQRGTLFAATEAFDRQMRGRDPLGTRKRPSMRVKRTAEQIAIERQERLNAQQEARDQAYMEGANPSAAESGFLAALGQASAASGTEKLTAAEEKAKKRAEMPFRSFSIQARAAERDQARQQRQQTAAAQAAAAEADRPFQEASTEAKRLEKLQRDADTAAKKAAAEAKRQAKVDRITNPEGRDIERNMAQDELSAERAQLRSMQRRVPRRGFGASLTDLVTSAFGGGAFSNQLEQAGRAEAEFSDLQSLSQQRADLRARRTDLRGTRAALPMTSPQRATINTEVLSLNKQIAGLDKSIDTTRQRFNQFSGEASKASTVLKSFGAAAAGSVVSTGIGAFTVGLGMAVAAPIITAVTTGIAAVVGPAIEQASGFAGTTTRVTGAISDDQRARGISAEAATAGALARTGIAAGGAAQISPLIRDRADIEAGNKALVEQVDMLRTQQNLMRDQASFGKFDKGLSQTTGGQFGTPLFGIPSTAEIVGNELKNAPSAELRATQQFQLNEIATLMATTSPTSSSMKELTKAAGALIAELAKGDTALALFNGQAEKGGSALKLVTDAAEAEKSAAYARSVGLDELASQFERSGRGVAGAKSGEDIQSYLAAVNRGSTRPTARLLLEEQADQTRAQIQFEDTQRRFQIGTTNPQTFAMAEAARPLGPAAAGINTTGLTKKQAADVNAELKITQGLYDDIARETEAGVTAAKEFVATTFAYDPQVGADFAASLDKVAATGKQITNIEVGLQTKQAAYSAAQFAFQINIAKRNLADAKGLVSGVGDSMGALERQMHDLQRESQSLSLGQSQRQINFAVAVAGFQAPGLSSEEAGARRDQAKVEAEYAQKQLDIQKKLFGLSGTQFNRGASRQVRDLERQLNLLEQGRVLSVETAAAEKKIIALTKIQAKENKNVETFYNAAVLRTGDVQGKIAELVAATGQGMREVGKITLEAFKNQYEDYIDVITGNLDGGTVPHQVREPGAMGKLYMGDGTHAEGWMGSVNGKTSFGKYGVAGEAGGEAVAILRDPKMLTSPSGGGGGDTFIVQIFNPIIKNDEDKTRLIADVKRAIQKEAALLLPRRA